MPHLLPKHLAVAALALTLPSLSATGEDGFSQSSSIGECFTGTLEPHAQIVIRGDEVFPLAGLPIGPLLPGQDKGIRSGTGTAEDPYRIENWTIHEEGPTEPALSILESEAYFVIRNIHFLPNHTNENQTGSGLRIRDSSHIVADCLSAAKISRAVDLFRATDVLVSRVTARDNAIMTIEDSTNIRVTSSDLQGSGVHIQWLSSQGEISTTTLINAAADGLATGWLEGLQPTAISIGPSQNSARPSDIAITSVTIRSYKFRAPPGLEGPALAPTGEAAIGIGASNAVITNVTALDGDFGLRSHNATFYVAGSTFSGNRINVFLTGDCPRCVIQSSEFSPRGGMHVLNQANHELDAENNWWSSSAGPRKSSIRGNVDYDPWQKRDSGGPDSRNSPSEPWVALSTMALLALILDLVARRRFRGPPRD